jgi:hypothetical protein
MGSPGSPWMLIGMFNLTGYWLKLCDTFVTLGAANQRVAVKKIQGSWLKSYVET